MIVFFFSSRRRHTRLQGDWSSDVCSSDLGAEERMKRFAWLKVDWPILYLQQHVGRKLAVKRLQVFVSRSGAVEIGRASCRERVEMSGGEVSVQQTREGGSRREERREWERG